MIKKGFGIILFFIVVNVASVNAQQYLTLEQCRQLAIENNKSLKMATEQERVAYYNKKEALSKFFPEVQFVGGYLRNQKDLHLFSKLPSSLPLPVPIGDITSIDIPDNIRDGIFDLGKVETKNLWAGGFNLVQPLFMGGKIVAYNDLRSYAQELATVMKDTKLTDVIVEVDNAYWQVVSVANKKRLAESYVGLMQKMDSDISAMFEEGVATKADRLSVSVKLNEAEMTLTKAENGLSLAKMLLSQLCGLDITDAITVRDENISEVPIPYQTMVMPDANEALANRTEIRSLELATNIYKQQEKIAMADYMPNVAFTANYLWTNPNLFNGFEKKVSGMLNIGVIVKVPLNFFSTSTKVNAAKAETQIKRFEMADAKEKITLQVNQSTYKLNEAYKKLTAAKKNSEKADENLQYANYGFEEGVITASDAMAAHTAWMSAHSELIDAQIDVVLSQVYLNKALGRKLY